MSVALIEPLVEMTATLNVGVSINSTTVMQSYGQPQNKRNLSKIIVRQMYCAGICRDAERVAGAERKAPAVRVSPE